MQQQKITPFLWFDKEAGLAARFYAEVFQGAVVGSPTELENTPSGSDQIYQLEILGQRLTLMNAGPHFQFNEAISFVIDCADQAEVDYYWERLTADGGEPRQCGWLKDRFGLSWQVVPRQLQSLLAADPDGKVLQTMLGMQKLNIAELQAAQEKAPG